MVLLYLFWISLTTQPANYWSPPRVGFVRIPFVAAVYGLALFLVPWSLKYPIWVVSFCCRAVLWVNKAWIPEVNTKATKVLEKRVAMVQNKRLTVVHRTRLCRVPTFVRLLLSPFLFFFSCRIAASLLDFAGCLLACLNPHCYCYVWTLTPQLSALCEVYCTSLK